MSTYIPALHVPIAVTTSNKWIDFIANTSLTYAAEISVSTYTNIWTLCSAVSNALTACTVGWTVSYTQASTGTHTTPLPYVVKIRNAALDDWHIHWATGAHTASNAHTILGFANTDTTWSGTTYANYANYQPPNVWQSTRAPASDSFDRREHVGGEFRRTLSGVYSKRLTVATPRKRKVEFEELPAMVTLKKSATSTELNRDFETWWQTAVECQSFQYFADYTSSTSSGTYYLVEPVSLEKGISRPHKDVETYNFGVEMVRKE